MHSGSRSEDRDRVPCGGASSGQSGDACAVIGEGVGALTLLEWRVGGEI